MNLFPFVSQCFGKRKDEHSQETNRKDPSKSFKEADSASDDTFSPGSESKPSGQYQSILIKKNYRQDQDNEGRIGQRVVDSTDNSTIEDGIEFPEENFKGKAYTDEQWRKVLRNNDLENTSVTELLHSLRSGIPDELRPQIWEFLTQSESLRKEYAKGHYQQLKDLKSQFDQDIRKDVGRTFPLDPLFKDNPEYMENLLFNILRAYSNHDKQVGYTQGMNYLVGKLLIILHPENYATSNLSYFQTYDQDYEEKVFWIFVHIASIKNWRQIYRNNFPKMHGMISVLEDRLKLKVPGVYEALQNNKEVDFRSCFHSMFICLLIDCSPTPVAKRLLDLFFIEEEKILFKVIIRAIILCKKEILEASKDESLLKFLKHEMIPKSYEKCKGRLYLLFPGTESSD